MSGPAAYVSIAEFLLNSPLYKEFALGEDVRLKREFFLAPQGQVSPQLKIDGYCPVCKKDTTFTASRSRVDDSHSWVDLEDKNGFDQITLHCARHHEHSVRYHFLFQAMVVQKVGQFPSLADIAIDETRQKYRSVLKGQNFAEFYKAIGLAAHGEGIGSFVYLRRVFERLIKTRFETFKAQEGWADEQFAVRMEDKIQLLKDHLPPYLVEIRKIYSIFSKGIHELDNETCLQFFEIGKKSIMIILADDLKHMEEIAARKEMAEAVAKFSGEPEPAAIEGGKSGGARVQKLESNGNSKR